MKAYPTIYLFLFLCCNAFCSRAFAIGHTSVYDTTIKPGDTKTAEYLPLLAGKRVGVIINQTSVADNELLLDLLLHNDINVTKIFVPEHGFRGGNDAGATVANSKDSATGLPVISLYGNNKKPTAAQLADIDILIYDLQDVGARFYTYISTLQYAMEACAENKVAFMVLDRPDPNGYYVDGPVLDTAYSSFVGMQPIPVVYGMTAGEYAKMLVGEKRIKHPFTLKVVTCANYDHTKKYLLPVSPSPNLKTMASIYAYPSMCLFEGTPVSVGRGTVSPFMQWGCPEFAGKFSYSFTPQSINGATKPPFENKKCFGVFISTDEGKVAEQLNNSVYLDWLINAYNAYPDKEKFFNSFFDKLAGNHKLQEQIKKGMTSQQIHDSWQKELNLFKSMRKKYLLYKDFEN